MKPPPAEPAPAAWWLAPGPDDGAGLAEAQAAQALQRWGPNSLALRPQRPLALQFLARFRNPLVLILLAASAVSAGTGDLGNCLIIVAMVLLSVSLDFVQEHRAGRAAERLRDSVALRTRALRDGGTRELPVAALVPGDLVLLAAGDRVPADARVLAARDFFVDQALLTGESWPVEKRPEAPPAGAVELQQASNAVFTGCTVVSGSARVRVVLTGARTALGELAREVRAEPPPTAFEVGLHRFGLLILRVTVALVLFVLLANVGLHRPLLESFLFAVALAVGLTPELLPMVVTVTLSRGALRMAQRRVIVKRLAAIQNLGAMNVLCTDKTGTLTEARMSLAGCTDADGREAPRALMLAQLNSAFESGLKSPLDEALLAQPADLAGWRKLDEVPFDFERRRVSVLAARGGDGPGDAPGDGERWLVVKGAPDEVLAQCSHAEREQGQVLLPLDPAGRAALHGRCQDLERQGLRVLAIAWRRVPPSQHHAGLADEQALVFAGFAAFVDPPKAGAAEALAALKKSGVAVKIVTGDSEGVTRHLCGLLKLHGGGLLTGRDIAAMDDAALRARVGRTALFCRVNPAQKNRIILALKARGHVVGYLGDGVNDAPSLRSADVGLTVDGAADVAREVADMVMLEHDLAVLHEGVQEGRRTFGNVLKYIMMGTSSNFGNMLTMAVASLFLPFLPMLPSQILLNNVLYDLSEAAIPLDAVDAQDLRRPRVLDMGFVRRYMALFGTLSSLFDALTFAVLLLVLRADPASLRTGWFLESLLTQVMVIFVIRTRGRPWASRPSPALAASSLAVVAVGLLLPYSPAAALFDFRPLPAHFFAWLAALLGAYLLAAELAKRLFTAISPPARRPEAPGRRHPRPVCARVCGRVCARSRPPPPRCLR